jgi:hydrogenase/urease accessory protein HupE
VIRALILALAVLIVGGSARAHEVRPGYLEITRAPGGYHVLWKQPTVGLTAVRLAPRLSGGWLDGPPATQSLGGDYRLETWDIASRDAQALRGRTITIDGLAGTMTDVLVRVSVGDGQTLQTILRPDRPSVTLDLAAKAGLAPLAYLRLGIEHILTGFDHLSFVLGLLLLVGFERRLLAAITAFTVAHSITLAATALGWVRVSPPLIEAMVAMSILFLAAELVRARRGEAGLTSAHPWLIAFAFGLLHGFAFAGALADVGLPRDAIPLSLFLFNVGVEIGQLIFLAAVWTLTRLVVRPTLLHLPPPAVAFARAAPSYVIGTLAAYWVWGRLGPIFA